MSRRCYKGKSVSIQTITTHLASNLSEAGRPIFSLKTNHLFIQYRHRWVTFVCFRDPIFVSNLNRLRNIQSLFESRQTEQLCVQSYCVGFRYFWILGVIVRQIFFLCSNKRILSIAFFIHFLVSTKWSNTFARNVHSLNRRYTEYSASLWFWNEKITCVTSRNSHPTHIGGAAKVFHFGRKWIVGAIEVKVQFTSYLNINAGIFTSHDSCHMTVWYKRRSGHICIC